MNTHGYDPRRQAWADEAAWRFFPAALREMLPNEPVEIEYPSGGMKRMDTEYGVDALVKTAHRSTAWALRVRGGDYYHYGDITVRYQSQQTPGKELESKHTVARFMWFSWVDTPCLMPPDHLLDWHVVSLQALLDYWQRGTLKPSGPPRPNTDKSSTLLPFAVRDLTRLNLIRYSMAYPVRAESAASPPGGPRLLLPGVGFQLGTTVVPPAHKGTARQAQLRLDLELEEMRRENRHD